MTKKIPYKQRNDIEKIKSNWTKTNGLLKREEWSMSIIRAVTTVELAANYAIKKELSENRNLELDFVNHLLIWANGIFGKFDKLLLPIFKNNSFQSDLKKLKKQISEINKDRNSVVHSGQYKTETTAIKIIDECKTIIETIIQHYDVDFELKALRTKKNLKKNQSK